MNDAQELINQVAEIFEEDTVSYDVVRDGAAIRSGYRGQNGRYQVLIGAEEDPPLLYVDVEIPLLITEAKRRDMAEAIVRINSNLTLGRFDIDMSHGEVTFYTAIPLLGATLTTEQFRATMATALHNSDRYYRAFGRLLFDNDLTPMAAVAEIDMAEREEEEPQQ